MTIKEIISKHYDELHGYCTGDKVISLSKTEEDILQDVCVTAMKKFKEKDIEESVGMDYLKLTLYNEQLFQCARKKKDKLVLVESIDDYDKADG
jgi:hypothetical protein